MLKNHDKTQLVLIVDDIPKNLQVLGSVLKKEGYRIAFAQSGESALEYVAENKPDLILMDIMMPGMDGYEVCKRLKREPETEDIPVIFVTALGDADDEHRGFALGGVDYITKPFNLEIVKAWVKTHLQLKRKTAMLENVIKELNNTLAEIKTLQGILPICVQCKKIRNDKGYWDRVEWYMEERTDVRFSHGICPECVKKLYPEFAEDKDTE
ncbi:MAG: response regulator [Candidatus Electrothrix sp. ATG2]|nr:response regulator [Candidatus Electrothrix sp. ATG2]